MRRGLTQLFIVAYLCTVVLWALPGSTARDRLVRLYEPYMLWIGLWQGWDMFAPNPLSINISVTATITFQDGRSALWVSPRMEKLGFVERYQKERYRKWRERIREDRHAAAWPDTARYLARLHHTPTRRPVHVTLTRYWSELAPPSKTDPLPFPRPGQFDQHFTFFEYDVQASDL